MKKIFRILALTLIIATFFNGVSITSQAAAVINGDCSATGSKVRYEWIPDWGELRIYGSGQIDSMAFCSYYWSGAKKIKEVRIINSSEGNITGIGDGAFEGCTALEEIRIPSTVTYMGLDAFDGCTSLKKVYIEDLASWCKINRTNIYGYASADSNPLYYADELYVDYELLSSDITIPNGVTEIKEYAFAGFSNLTSISIPNTVTSIGEGAFQNCSNLTSASIPNGVETIGECAFYECENLATISMLPYSVTSIGVGAFAGCQKLSGINVSTANNNYCAVSGVLYNKGKTTLVQYPAGKTNVAYTPQSTTTAIGDYAFYECENIKNIVLDKKISHIGGYAFWYCTNLEVVDIYNDNFIIPDSNVFYGCKKLTIYGNENSSAQTYAKSKNINFKTFLWKNIITPQAVINNGKLDITVSVNKDIKNNKLFCAFCDAKGVLLKTQIIDVPSTSESVKFNITDDSRYSYMKAMLWSDMEPSAIIGTADIR